MTTTNKPKKSTKRGGKPKSRTIVQAGKFSIVGIINTLIDFIALNIFTAIFGLPRIPANVASATIAIAFSFMANRQLVFKPSGQHYFKQAILFLVVTAFGLYVLQNLIIFGLTEYWTWPLDTGYSLVKALGLDQTFSLDFVYTNGAKAVATAFSMVWNFVFYKKVVFKND